MAKRTNKKGKGKARTRSRTVKLCEYEIDGEFGERMVMKCKKCPGSHDLAKGCLGPIITAFSGEYDIERINMAHYVEREFHGETITLLKKIARLSEEIENLSLRSPTKEYTSKKIGNEEEMAVCSKCTLLPRRLFPNMQKRLIKDLSEFHIYLKKMTSKIPRFKNKRKICGRCISDTTEDMNYIYNKYENIVGFIINHSTTGGNMAIPNWDNSNNGVLNQYLTPLMGYQQNLGVENVSLTQTCNVCMYPLRGTESNCPNCSTRLAWR